MVLSMARPWKHPKTGMYWFRKVVPAALRPLVGKTEVRRSLRTKDPRAAALRHPKVAAEVAAEWESLCGTQTQTLTLSALPPRYARHSNSPDALRLIYEEALSATGYTDERDTPQALRATGYIDEQDTTPDWTPPAAVKRLLDATLDPPTLTLKDMLAGWWTEAKATGRKPSTYESYRHTVEGLET
ncbi:MAG TPA: DUF6538 domain-containing protein, partial [Roseiarcus sp.]